MSHVFLNPQALRHQSHRHGPAAWGMELPRMFHVLRAIQDKLTAIEEVMGRRSNMIAFLVVRFILMSGMVVGFAWWSLSFSS